MNDKEPSVTVRPFPLGGYVASIEGFDTQCGASTKSAAKAKVLRQWREARG